MLGPHPVHHASKDSELPSPFLPDDNKDSFLGAKAATEGHDSSKPANGDYAQLTRSHLASGRNCSGTSPRRGRGSTQGLVAVHTHTHTHTHTHKHIYTLSPRKDNLWRGELGLHSSRRAPRASYLLPKVKSHRSYDAAASRGKTLVPKASPREVAGGAPPESPLATRSGPFS